MHGIVRESGYLGWRRNAILRALQGKAKVRQVVFLREVARDPCYTPQALCTLGELQVRRPFTFAIFAYEKLAKNRLVCFKKS